MIQVDWMEEKIDGAVLFDLLDRHKLLPSCMTDPQIAYLAAQGINLGFMHDGGEKPLVILLETIPEPGFVSCMFITEKARIHQRRQELIEASHQLRAKWFDTMGAWRVESRIPMERTQTIRMLRHLGFRIETGPKGIRNGSYFSGQPKDICIMGLLPDDPYKTLNVDISEPIMMQED